MDNSRNIQLMRFRREMCSTQISPINRKRAARAFYRIKRQLRDPILARLRYEYMRADAAADEMARMHIGDKVQAYMFRVYKQRI